MLDRTLAPPFIRSTSFQLPEVTKVKLTNGVNLLYLSNVQQQVVKIEVVFNAGKWFEEKPEVSHFTTQMLDKGTQTKSSKQIAELFDSYGGHIELSSSFDFVSVSLYSLSVHLSKLYPLFIELITEPAFNEDELVQLKDHFLQGLKVKNEKTSYLASKLIRKKVFGDPHPYGQSPEESDINKIEVQDLLSFFAKRMKPLCVFVLGQINTSDVNIIEQGLSAINIDTHPKSIVSSYTTPIVSLEHLEKTNSIQSSIRLGKQIIQRDHSDYPGLLILNYYLGGYFGSRLMKNIREEKGLTYGISSSINSFQNGSILLIGTDVNKENRLLATSEILKEINLLQDSINIEELELAKRHFIGSLQGEMASPFSIQSKIKNLELYHLPGSYYQNMINTIDSISITDLKLLAKKYLAAGSFSEVTVG